MALICLRCPDAAKPGYTYCEKHLRSNVAPGRPVKPRERKPTRKRRKRNRFYDSPAWIRLRVRKLLDDPWCAGCSLLGDMTPAEHVDHVKPLRAFPDLGLEESNLQSLCASCHIRKTHRERRGQYYDFERGVVYEESNE